MITTVTLNPMLDKTVAVDSLRRGAVSRASEVSTIVGGKGVNVSRQLSRLGEETVATGFIGGEIGSILERLLDGEKIPHRFIRIAGMTREGVTYLEPEGTMTSVFEPPHSVTLAEAGRLLEECRALADEVEHALHAHAIVPHAKLGQVYAYEVDAFGNYYCIDDGNVPSLLSLPYLGAVPADDSIYQATRHLVLSDANPYYCQGKAAKGPGGPHVGMNMIWPLGLIVQGLTSTHDQEIRQCLTMLQKTHAGKGFMHEAFHKDDPNLFTRSWFALANTIFGERVLKTFHHDPKLLG